MEQPQAHGSTPNHVLVALEASCGALLALEFARLEMAEAEAGLEAAQTDTEEAMVLVRRAVDVLRAAAAEDDELLSLGFVLGVGHRPSS